jgi:hypothetical protein
MKRTIVQGGFTDEKGIVYRKCPKCAATKPLDEFGLRTMKRAGPDGEDVVRNQSWCRACRFPRKQETT